MSRQVDFEEVKANLSQLVEDAGRGEEIVIVKDGKPVAKLTVVPPGQPAKKRELGQWAHLMTPEERAYYDSEQFLHDWKEMDAEIERDFEESVNRPFEEPIEEFKWDDISSTPAPLSAPKKALR